MYTPLRARTRSDQSEHTVTALADPVSPGTRVDTSWLGATVATHAGAPRSPSTSWSPRQRAVVAKTSPRATPVEALNVLSAAGYTMYYPNLAHTVGDAKTAFFLSRMLSWTRYANRRDPLHDGWIWQTGEEIEHDTGLSRPEQASARRRLIAMNLLSEQRAWVPARLLYRVQLDTLITRATANAWQRRTEWVWDAECIRSALGVRSLVIHANALAVTGDTLAALYLSQLMAWMRSALFNQISAYPVKIKGDEAWIECPIAALREHIGLTRKMQRRCRALLLEAGLIKERYTDGMSPKLHTAVCLTVLRDAITRRVANSSANQIASRREAQIAPCDLEISKNGTSFTVSTPANAPTTHADLAAPRKRSPARSATSSARGERTANPSAHASIRLEANETAGLAGVALFANLEWPKVEIRSGPNSQTSLQDRATTQNKVEINQLPLLQPSSSINQGPVTPFRAGSRRLAFELPGSGLTAAEGLEVDRLAQHVGQNQGQEAAQQLIDELAYALRQTDKPVRNPVGYFAALVRRKDAGTFLPAGAHRVEAARASRKAETDRQHEQEQARQAAQSPEQRDRDREAAMNALAALRASRKGAR